MNMKKNVPQNPFADRLAAFAAKLRCRHISVALIQGESNQKGLVDFGCDNGILCVVGSVPMFAGSVPTFQKPVFFTDFRYVPAAKREAPWLKVCDISRFNPRDFIPSKGPFKVAFEGSVPTSRYLELQKAFGKRAKFVDLENDVLMLRAV